MPPESSNSGRGGSAFGGPGRDPLHRPAHPFRGEVVQEHPVRPRLQGLGQLHQVGHLHLQGEPGIGLPGPLDGGGDPPGGGDVVLLDQDHVEEAPAVVHPAPAADGVLGQDAHPRHRLPGVQHPDPGPLQGRRRPPGGGGDAGEVLEEVEGGPLAGEDPTGGAAEPHHHLAGAHRVAVGGVGLEEESRVHGGEHHPGGGQAAEHPLLLGPDLRLGRGALGHRGQGGGVPGADVLGQGRLHQGPHQLHVQSGFTHGGILHEAEARGRDAPATGGAAPGSRRAQGSSRDSSPGAVFSQ